MENNNEDDFFTSQEIETIVSLSEQHPVVGKLLEFYMLNTERPELKVEYTLKLAIEKTNKLVLSGKVTEVSPTSGSKDVSSELKAYLLVSKEQAGTLKALAELDKIKKPSDKEEGDGKPLGSYIPKLTKKKQ
jgi:hypothetical protein